MPGNILSVNVNVGDTVAEGQVLMILEAMKMENEIMAPKAGKVTSVTSRRAQPLRAAHSSALLAKLNLSLRTYY